LKKRGTTMDEASTKDTIQRHAEAVERGDFDTVVGDLSKELQAQAATIAQTLPQPVRSAKVLSVEVGDVETVARIHYAGDRSEVTVQSHWRDIDGRPRIVQAGPVV
jgi:hypothetical protein